MLRVSLPLFALCLFEPLYSVLFFCYKTLLFFANSYKITSSAIKKQKATESNFCGVYVCITQYQNVKVYLTFNLFKGNYETKV